MNLLLLLTSLAAIEFAAGATFNVNSTADMPDIAPGNGVCRAANNKCTLRAAVQEANQDVVSDIILLPAGIYKLTLGQLQIAAGVTFRGSSQTTTVIDAAGKSRVLVANNGTVVEIWTLTMRNGFILNDDGGCVLNQGQLTLNKVVVSGCKLKGDGSSDLSGGGIANFGLLTLLDSQVTHNTVDNPVFANSTFGAGIANHPGARLVLTRTMVDGNVGLNASNTLGGGIFNDGNLDISESTVAQNRGEYGGIFNWGIARLVKTTVANNTGDLGSGGIANYADGVLTLINCTISGNSGVGSRSLRQGGGVSNIATLRILNSTIFGNRGGAYATGGINHDARAGNGTATIKNSIVAGNVSTSSPDCDSITSLTYSLIGNTKGCAVPAGTGNLRDLNPMLGPLANNGGKTQTHALLPGSVAINAGSPSPVGSGGNSCEKTDQRGVTRPQDGRCDMGAYERRPGLPHGSEVTGEEAGIAVEP